MSNPVIMKFGGTSVGDAARILGVASIIAKYRKDQKQDVVVVVSAMSTVTNLLLSAASNATGQRLPEMELDLGKLQDLHARAIAELQLPAATSTPLNQIIGERLAHLRKLLESLFELGELTPRAQDLVVSFGERMSIHLVAEALSAIGVPAEPIEANRLIVTSASFGSAVPDLEQSELKAKPVLAALIKQGIVPVVTGFIGANSEGVITTLGRGGSDYSGTILGYCLDASAVQIWTDVDGVMTADPRIASDAHTVDALSYNEASELSYFGAKVLHPLTMAPAVRKNTPIWIKNTFNPEHPGTKISNRVHKTASGGKAITTIRNVSLVTVQGRGMLGVPGIAAKVFGAVATSKINVLFISQSSSEFNISFIVPEGDGVKAVHLLQKDFRMELMDKSIETITAHHHLAIVAVIGEGMKGHSGVAGRIFSALGTAEINIMAIAQGSSERNISLVIADSDAVQAVQSIHQAFDMGQTKVPS